MTAGSEYSRITGNSKKQILLEREQIKARIAELGAEITRDYQDKKPVLIGVLNGCFIFIADLVRRMQLDMEIDFVKLSSYGNEQESSGKIKIHKDINTNIQGRHVLVVEDIVDTGLSVGYLHEKLSALEPASLKFVTLLKKDKAKITFKIDYIGFEIPDRFVVGYGLDHGQLLRNLPDIYTMDRK